VLDERLPELLGRSEPAGFDRIQHVGPAGFEAFDLREALPVVVQLGVRVLQNLPVVEVPKRLTGSRERLAVEIVDRFEHAGVYPGVVKRQGCLDRGALAATRLVVALEEFEEFLAGRFVESFPGLPGEGDVVESHFCRLGRRERR